jgi:hypothetical protein
MSPVITERPDDFHLESSGALLEAVPGEVKRKTCLKLGLDERMDDVM